uniref:(northern house mosquito) hypothetical protein n=1 Tax=Culex pipiens TaxID=7175 RepID=A0A8D8HGU1_CULPI
MLLGHCPLINNMMNTTVLRLGDFGWHWFYHKLMSYTTLHHKIATFQMLPHQNSCHIFLILVNVTKRVFCWWILFVYFLVHETLRRVRVDAHVPHAQRVRPFLPEQPLGFLQRQVDTLPERTERHPVLLDVPNAHVVPDLVLTITVSRLLRRGLHLRQNLLTHTTPTAGCFRLLHSPLLGRNCTLTCLLTEPHFAKIFLHVVIPAPSTVQLIATF